MKKSPTAPLRHKVSDIVAIMIKQLVVDNQLEPGDKLPSEKELIETFQVGRGTVRESLKALEVQGIVKRVTGRHGGTRVAEVSHVPVMQFVANYLHFQEASPVDIYSIRVILEPIMAESAVGNLTEDDFEELEQKNRICRLYLEGEVTRLECRKAELDFHDIIARSCPNPFLFFLCTFMNYILYNYLQFKSMENEMGREFAANNLEYHERLLAAFRDQDGEEVRRYMSEHMNNAFDYIVKLKASMNSSLLSNSEKHLI